MEATTTLGQRDGVIGVGGRPDALCGLLVDDDVLGEIPDLHGVTFEQQGRIITVAVCQCEDCRKRRAEETQQDGDQAEQYAAFQRRRERLYTRHASLESDCMTDDEQDRAFTEWHWPEAVEE